MWQALLAKPRWILLGFVALCIFFGSQASKFEINASADTLIADNNELYLLSQQITQRFAPEEFLLIAYRPRSGEIFADQSLAAIQAISTRVERLPRVHAVRSVLNVPLLSRASGLSTDLKPEEYTQQSLQLSGPELARLFRGHPIYEGLIVNPQQSASGIQVLFKPDPQLVELQRKILELQAIGPQRSLTNEERQTLDRLRADAEPLERNLRSARNREIGQLRDILAEHEADAEIFLGGVHVLGYQLINIVRSDLVVFGAAIGLVICLLLLLLFRRWQWLMITILCCGCSLLTAIGVFGLFGLQATVISANFISLQLILSLAIVIHLIVQYRENAAASSSSHAQLVSDTLGQKLAPCFFAGFTTSVGFASLLFSDIKPVASFGWMMVAAMAVTLLCTLLLFPALLLLVGKLDTTAPGSVFTAPLSGLQALCQHHGAAVITVFGLLLVASIVGALRLDVENSFIDYFQQDTLVHKELTFIDREFGGSTPLDIIYTPPARERDNSQLILRAVDVQNTHRIQDELDAMPAMGSTLSVVNFTRLARQINDDKPLTEYELTSLYRLLDAGIRESLVGSFFVQSPTQLRISARVQDSHEGLDRKQMLDTIHQRIQGLGIEPSQYQLSNLFVLYQAMLQQLFASQILTLGVVFLALTLAFWLIFRSLRIALVAMAPNIVSAVAVLGFMGWFAIPLDFMTITIAAISMGIAVDDTIHYTHRYLYELNNGSSREALTRAHHSVGFALVYTSTIIALGFSLLMFSDFVPSALFGLLTALVVIFALLADLTLLPVLLARFVATDNNVRER